MEVSKLLSLERVKIAERGFKDAFENYSASKQQALGRIDAEALKKKVREIKEKSISRLNDLKKRAVENLTANGIKVFEAKDAEDARKIALELIPEGAVVAKAKSNTISEIELAKALVNRELIETDCGDFIVSLCKEKAIHPVTPALHIPVETIVKNIEQNFGVKLENTPESIVNWVRSYIREKICEATIGLTGANFISSDGCIIILENEGNISLVSRLPEKHVVVAGIDRIVETLEDAMLLCKAVANWGSGINMPTYINIITSPSKTADIEKKIVYGVEGAKEVYLILVDNGRSKAIADGLEEILYCINCGSCLYYCPVYRQVFDSYGLHYFGGIGVAKTAFTNGLINAVERGLYFCTMCQACKINCPVSIDVPRIVRKLRELSVGSNLETEANVKMIKNVRVYGNPFGEEVKEGKLPEKLYCC